ncbi:MAG: dephospho-CoA kinase [Alphaproteobacteria bacterium]|nr:dephospho-CoA kinase [Alphaproteobacteria bacterium]
MKKRKRPIKIGLTGSIGMGKSTAARIFNSLGIAVHSADVAAHKAMSGNGAAVKALAKLFPTSKTPSGIDRKILGHIVFGNEKKLRQIEKILHPLVVKSEKRFVAKAIREKAKAVVLEIPLLFETNADKRCDAVVCVSASAKIQKERVMKRAGMTAERYDKIIKLQLPDKTKRKKADYVITTNKGLADTRRQIKKLWAELEE